jgi:hypothetical protein
MLTLMPADCQWDRDKLSRSMTFGHAPSAEGFGTPTEASALEGRSVSGGKTPLSRANGKISGPHSGSTATPTRILSWKSQKRPELW